MLQRPKRTKQYTKEELVECIIMFNGDKNKMANHLGLGTCSLRSQLNAHDIYCDARANNKTKKNIPPKEDLVELYKTKNMTEIGGIYGASNVTAKKWFIFHDIELLSHSDTIKTKAIPKTIAHNLEKYGVEHYYETQEFISKSKETCIERYGVDHYSKTGEYIEKRSNTCMDIYGVCNTFLLRDSVVEGQKKMFNGNVSWTQTDAGKKFFTESNPMSNKEVSEKSRFIRYETNWSLVPKDFLDAIIQKDKEKFVELIDELFIKHDNERIYISRELNISYSTLCRYIRIFDVQDRYVSPRGAPSVGEKEVYSFIKDMFQDAMQGNRTLLGDGREIDIYVPSKNFAVEYDGLYYHSEYSGNKDKHYHVSKTNMCESIGVQLIHIFDSEWNDPIKQKIIKSILKHKLGVSSNRIYARKCILADLTPSIATNFLNANHLSGFRGAKFHKGLYYNNELVSVMSIGEERYSKEKCYEITRFASVLDVSVVGGLSKLFKSFVLDAPVISYADRRYSTTLNSSYSAIFKNNIVTESSWWGFHKSDFILNHRLSYTKDKVKQFNAYDDTLSVFDNMVLNGYDRVWDCGNIKFYN